MKNKTSMLQVSFILWFYAYIYNLKIRGSLKTSESTLGDEVSATEVRDKICTGLKSQKGLLHSLSFLFENL